MEGVLFNKATVFRMIFCSPGAPVSTARDRHASPHLTNFATCPDGLGKKFSCSLNNMYVKACKAGAQVEGFSP